MEDNKLSSNDHDLLITMAATSKIGIADLKTDIAQVNTNIAELKGTFTAQHTSLDARVKAIETLVNQTNPLAAVRLLNKHDEFINDYKSTHKERNVIFAFWISTFSILLAASDTLWNILMKK